MQDLRFWVRFPVVTANHGQQEAGGFSPKSYTGRLPSEVQPLTLWICRFDRNTFHCKKVPFFTYLLNKSE